ncbi:MAG: GNAT family N-acetyltransferase [Anaerolineae bacterium]|jgi:ribosomal protein S18 acetylase RimI-like enzyme|nr:GNAT family N-acetyltransferase [Anaerolineae bacterium]
MPKPNDIIIREAIEDDLDGLLDLYAHLSPNDAPSPPRARVVELWQEIIANPMLTYFVAEQEGQLVCSCNLTIVPNLTRGARPFGVIENVITHPDFRRRGVGKAILDRAIETAKQAGCYKVMLLSGTSRKEAHALYEKVGFSKDTKLGFDLRLP